jgi:predicted glutamine amidotransferase
LRFVCRLLGYVADRPTSVVEVLGEDGFARFTALTAVHADGWGMAWQAEDHTLQSVSVADSASQDATYDSLARTPLGRAGFVHLRWASVGLPVLPVNTHPFVEAESVAGSVAFAHNGHIAPIDRLEGLLDDASRERLRGDTDSERYFRFVLQCIEKEGDADAGVARALGVLVEEFPRSSLNALMLTPRQMYAVHINSSAAAPQRRLRELFDNEDDIPARHTTEYFAMDYRLREGAVHVISSGLDEEGWTPVPSDTASVVDLATREIRTLQLRD